MRYRQAVIGRSCSAILVFVVAACGEPGAHPFRQVQFCLTQHADGEAFKILMRDLARREGLRFGDRSREAESELRSLQALEESFPLILISGENSEYGFGASNAGLPNDQISIGFRAPASPEARAFAERTISELKEKWEVADVPDGRGALPINCT
jgi:hypothetical protein